MNLSSLPIYTSKQNLTTPFVDYSNVYLLPLVCLFGILTSALSLLVTYPRNKANSRAIDFIFVNSAIDFIFLLIESFLFLIRCGSLCPYAFTYAAKFYEIYIYLFVGYTLITSQVFFSILVSFERLSVFSNKKSPKISIYRAYVSCLLISIVFNALPYLIAKEVAPLGIYSPNDNSTVIEILYIRTNRESFKHPFLKEMVSACLIIKDPVMYFVLLAVNVMIYVRYQNYLRVKSILISAYSISPSLNQQKLESNFTRLALFYCGIFFISNFVDSFSMLANFLAVDVYVKYGYINICGNFLFFASHGAHFFVNFCFNSDFRRKCVEFSSKFQRAKIAPVS